MQDRRPETAHTELGVGQVVVHPRVCDTVVEEGSVLGRRGGPITGRIGLVPAFKGLLGGLRG